MTNADEHYEAIKGRVTFGGKSSDEHAHALASHFAETNVPAEHTSRIAAFHTGHQGSFLYHPDSHSMLIPGDPTRDLGPAMRSHNTRRLAHEVGHAYAHDRNGDRVKAMMRSEHGTGLLEGNAENYADRAVPGSHSGYDYEVAKGGRSDAFSSGYKAARGPMFGNIDPRLPR